MLTTHDGRITAGEQAFIDQAIAQRSGRPGALLGILEAVQNRNPHKYLPQDTLRYIAAKTETPLSRIYSVATFYALFNLQAQLRGSTNSGKGHMRARLIWLSGSSYSTRREICGMSWSEPRSSVSSGLEENLLPPEYP